MSEFDYSKIKWIYGTPKGSVTPLYNGNVIDQYLARFNDNGRDIKKYFKVSDSLSEEKCKEMAEEYLLFECTKRNLLRNKIGYADNETIAIKIGDNYDDVCLVDACNLDFILSIELHILARIRGKGPYVIYYEADGSRKFLANKISGIENIKYQNLNTFDLRLNNLKVNGKVNALNLFEYHKYYFMDLNELPKNVWILGNPKSGTTLKKGGKGNIINMDVRINGERISKVFNSNKFISKLDNSENNINNAMDKARLEARKFLIDLCYNKNHLKNQIMITDNNTMNVKVEGNNIVTIDIKFLSLFIPDKTTLNNDLNLTITSHQNDPNSRYLTLYTNSDLTTNESKTYNIPIL